MSQIEQLTSLLCSQHKKVVPEFPHFLGLQRSEFTIAIRSFFSASCDVEKVCPTRELGGKIRRNLVEFLNLKFRFWLGDPPYYYKLIWGELRCFFRDKLWIRCSLTPMAPTTSGHVLWRGHDAAALFWFSMSLIPMEITYFTNRRHWLLSHLRWSFFCFQASAGLNKTWSPENKYHKPKQHRSLGEDA